MEPYAYPFRPPRVYRSRFFRRRSTGQGSGGIEGQPHRCRLAHEHEGAPHSRAPGRVIDKDHIFFLRAHGIAHFETKSPVTAATVFPINSAIKAFTGVACLKLAEGGKLDLNASVSVYFDDLPVTWRAVSIKQLMTHMSGLPDIIDSSVATIEGGNEVAAWAKENLLEAWRGLSAALYYGRLASSRGTRDHVVGDE